MTPDQHIVQGMARLDELAALAERFGWEVSDEFKRRYLTDVFVYNATNAAVVLLAENDRLRGELIEAKQAYYDLFDMTGG